jgi:hypothetical protein
MITPQKPLLRRAAAPGALALAMALVGAALDVPEARGGSAVVSNAAVIQQMELMRSQLQALQQKVNAQDLRSAEKDSEIGPAAGGPEQEGLTRCPPTIS